jgi:hypothetical protein
MARHAPSGTAGNGNARIASRGRQSRIAPRRTGSFTQGKSDEGDVWFPHSFAANAVRLQLHALAYNLRNFMRTLALPKAGEPWSLTSLREKVIKIAAKVVSHGRYVTFQMAEVAVSRKMSAEILSLIARLRAPPDLA